MKTLAIITLLYSLNAHAEKMKDFTLPVYKQNEKFILSENLKGKKVLLNFWATWCTSCIREMPQLEALKARYNDSVVFVAVNAGEQGNLIDKFFKKHKFTFIHLKDEDRNFSKSINVDALPVTIVVDKEMNIVYRDVVPPKEL